MAGEPLVGVDETAPLQPDSRAPYPATKPKAEQARARRDTAPASRPGRCGRVHVEGATRRSCRRWWRWCEAEGSLSVGGGGTSPKRRTWARRRRPGARPPRKGTPKGGRLRQPRRAGGTFGDFGSAMPRAPRAPSPRPPHAGLGVGQAARASPAAPIASRGHRPVDRGATRELNRERRPSSSAASSFECIAAIRSASGSIAGLDQLGGPLGLDPPDELLERSSTSSRGRGPPAARGSAARRRR